MDTLRVVASAALVAAMACGDGAPERSRFEQAVLDFNGHIIVTKVTSEFSEYREVAARARPLPGVRDVRPFVYFDAVVTVKGQQRAIGIKGVDLAGTPVARRIAPAGALDGYVPVTTAAPPPAPAALDPAPADFAPLPDEPTTDYSATAAPPPADPPVHVAVGAVLARELGLAIGDEVGVLVPDPLPDFAAPDPSAPTRAARVRVVALLETGIEYDERAMITSFAGAQVLLGRGDHALGLEIRLDRASAAVATARALEERLGRPYQVLDWCELNKNALRC